MLCGAAGGSLPWLRRLATYLAAVSCARIAQVPDFKQALVQGFDKNGRAGPCVLPETGHAEDDVVRLGVIAGAVAVGHHGAIAAEHLHCGGDLDQ